MDFKSYINSSYVTDLANTSPIFPYGKNVKVNESGLSRVWGYVSKYDSGTISAYRNARDCGKGDKYTRAENKKRNNILWGKLLKLGYSVTGILGTSIENFKSNNEIEVKERSFIVIDIDDKGNLEKDLKKLGNEFEQDSITYSKPNEDYYLIGTNKCGKAYPGFNKKVKLGKPFFGKKGIIYSKVNGRPFVFEEIKTGPFRFRDYSIAEIRSINYFSECELP